VNRHADHVAKIIAADRIRGRESGQRGRKDNHVVVDGTAKPTMTKAHPASRYRS